MSQPKFGFHNHLLRSLSPEDLGLIAPKLSLVRLDLRRSFDESNRPIEHICFPEAGIVSVVARAPGDRRIEAGLIGFEGMTGISVVMGDDRWPNETYVQLAGFGQIMSARDLREALDASPSLSRRLLQYAHVFMVQTSQTALANGRAKIDERLARWLLMAADRIEGLDLTLTHEFLSLMLGVRRPGVTDALHRLEGDHLVMSRRGVITIRNRAALERMASGSYGVPEAEYRRLFGALAGANGQTMPTGGSFDDPHGAAL